MVRILNKHTVVETLPTSEPVTVDDFKAFIKLQGDEDDNVILNTLKTARENAEQYIGRPIVNTTYKQTQDDFEYDGLSNYSVHNQLAYQRGIETIQNKQAYIKLLKKGLVSVTSVTTYNTSNTSSVYSSSDYFLDVGGNKIIVNENSTVPANLRSRAGVEIIYVAGFGSNIPQSIKDAILMHAQNMYDYNRLTDNNELTANPYSIPEGAKALLSPYKFELGLYG